MQKIWKTALRQWASSVDENSHGWFSTQTIHLSATPATIDIRLGRFESLDIGQIQWFQHDPTCFTKIWDIETNMNHQVIIRFVGYITRTTRSFAPSKFGNIQSGCQSVLVDDHLCYLSCPFGQKLGSSPPRRHVGNSEFVYPFELIWKWTILSIP